MIKEGDLVFLYFFDVGGEIELKSLEGLQEKLQKFGRTWIDKVPAASWIEDGMRIALGDSIEIAGEHASTEVKIFPVGCIAVKIAISIKDKDFGQVFDLLSRSEEETSRQGTCIVMTQFANEIATRIREAIKPLLTSQYAAMDYSERYRIILVRNGDREAIDKSRKEIAGLLRQEPFDKLGKEEVEEILGNRYTYRENFLVADIRGAFAFAKNIDAFPVLRAVEFCLLQKLELRVYDSLLDQMLERSYDILARAESKANRQLGERINEIHLMRLELLEIVSAMKSTRGSAKARVFYSMCETIGELFEIQDLADSVTRKLDRLGEIYTMVYDSLQSTRFIRMDRTMLMLETIIVILIVGEIILALIRK